MKTQMSCSLIAHTPNPEQVCAEAASLCYDSTMSLKVLKGCIASGHTSVLEHASFTFMITGVSRALLAQLTRHRLSSFSVRSQRYCVENDFQYIEPHGFSDAQKEVFENAMENANNSYKQLVELGAAPEDARGVLPNAAETRLVVTMNFRELMHFCNLRMCSRAQLEIRMLAYAMREEVAKVSPFLSSYLVPQCEIHAPYSFCTERKSCGRHPTLKSFYEA